MDNARPFGGNQVRKTDALLAWHRHAPTEAALEPNLPIIDTHHHLYGTPADASYYRLQDLATDIGGHRMLGTVYVEAYQAGWRASGPPGMRSLGEVERIVDLTGAPVCAAHGQCQIAAAIVSHVDLTLGNEVPAILSAHVAVGDGRLRGVRYQATYDAGVVGRHIRNSPMPGLLDDAGFRRGFACLADAGLTFDAAVYHTQLDEVARLADDFPDTVIILNHVGIPIGVEDYREQHDTVMRRWRAGLRELARRPNVMMKLGGLGMPVLGFGFEYADGPASSDVLAQAWRPYFETCVNAFGPARCMFESNFPVDKQSCSYTALWNAFKRATADCAEDERRDLFYRTACRVYHLPALRESGDLLSF
ncbi:amidohydrolase family protein [Cupriavidus alkaliphilus]|uniref:amidohydrolase family protein n=1 Tax=Cupriavidus alkaliphilus TaxID=942866 RepID=UPI001607EDDD|nr:amidohydrolase family protein [Cupriavidus alkaliphilus]MBB3014065.1 putative TIM-barrel fold metal-dependent hydrolase [Cupriavidus alkaliphilus]